MNIEDLIYQNVVRKGKSLHDWNLYLKNGQYYFQCLVADRTLELLTPNYRLVTTIYPEIANAIMDDFDHGRGTSTIDSLLYWQSITIDIFAQQSHETSEKMLISMYLQGEDWALDSNCADKAWVEMFGKPEERRDIIIEWLAKCSAMQLSAAYCLAVATGSLNLAYTVATIVETNDPEKWDDIFVNEIYKMVSNKTYRRYFAVTKPMKNFAIMYYIHVKEDGPLINQNLKLPQESNWRTNGGSIQCSDRDCTQECDETCPIALVNMAMEQIGLYNLDDALRYVEKALRIAPDYIDAWNTKGKIGSLKNLHGMEHDSYKKSYELNPTKPTTLRGYIAACLELGKLNENNDLFEKCIKLCDEYENVKHDDQVSTYKEEAYRLLGRTEQTNKVKNDTFIDGLRMMLDYDSKKGLLNWDGRSIPQIIEVAMLAKKLTENIFIDMTAYSRQNGFNQSFTIKYALMWSCFAGIGITEVWNDNYNLLISKDPYDILTSERGLFAMDEYVMDIGGYHWGSSESNAMGNRIQEWANRFCALISENHNDFSTIQEAQVSMYWYGMIIQMDKLGMH